MNDTNSTQQNYFRGVYPMPERQNDRILTYILLYLLRKSKEFSFLLLNPMPGDRYQIIVSYGELERAIGMMEDSNAKQECGQKIQHFPRCERCGCYYFNGLPNGYREIDGIVSRSNECFFCVHLKAEHVLETGEQYQKGGVIAAINYQKTLMRSV